MHFHVVLEREQLTKERVVQVAGQPAHQRLAEKIRPADGSDKQRIAREDTWRLTRLFGDD